MSLPWPTKKSFMDYVRRDQEEYPYVVGLKFGIEAKLSEFVCKEICVSEECCMSIVEDILSTSRIWL